MNKIKTYKNGDDKQRYQGDIGIIQVTPDKELFFTKLKENRLVVGHSETGHHHTVVREDQSELEVAQDEHGYFLKIVSGSAKIIHEKANGHETQVLEKPEGGLIYFFPHQFEYSEKEDRKVID